MKKKLNLLALSSLLISYSCFCSADDGEIFFNDKLTPAKPNVIFLLDTSGSMAWVPAADISRNPPYYYSPTKTNYTESRMDILKSSLITLLENKDITKDIKVGIITFSGNGNAQPITSNTPTSDIDVGNQRAALISNVKGLYASGGTPTVQALYYVARYLTPNSGGNVGPSHSSTLGNSPITEGCQLSHIILMSDGQPNNNNSVTTTARYIGASSSAYCQVITKDSNGKLVKSAEPRTSGGECGPALTSWMNHVDQYPQKSGHNYIKTHSIGFALSNANNTVTGSALAAKNFLFNLADYGGGKRYVANDKNTLLNAFTEIISDVRAADSPSASGTVTVGEQARFKQRTEVFYSLYSSDAYNYWPGNMKRFKIAYVETTLSNGAKGKRAVLVDKVDASAMSPDGTFYTTATSFWSSYGDGGKVSAGGVLENLKIPKDRKVFTFKKDEEVALEANPTAYLELGVSDTNVKNALLNFIRGYEYDDTGKNNPADAPKKIGDAARGRISLATYGCNTANAQGESDIVNCNKVKQTAFLASNDGFIRGYDINTGEALYEYMPEELLPLIQKLQRREVVSFKKPRYYGLDGKPVIYHEDTNNDGYINNEKAYVYIASGRGGRYIYALDISSSNSIKMAWQIEGGKGDFSKLGYTWSMPTLGKMKVNGEVTAVLVFGGGYDRTPQEDIKNIPSNDLFIVNAKNGNLIWSASSNNNIAQDMKYSVPSAITLVTDDSNDKLITDIFFGDMGGQVWRLNVNNAKSDSSNKISITGQVIAKLADLSSKDERKFYQAPAVYETKINAINMLSVNIGSGYRNHPLNLDIQDRIYSLRIPKDATTQKVITENTLGVAAADGQSITGTMTDGFMIQLTGEGEKVISDGYADFDRLVFNTFIPYVNNKNTCVPATGTQRTYNYDLITGKSLLEDPFISINITGLPPDITAYCDGRYCTIISDPSLLSKEKPLPTSKKDKDGFVVDTGENIFVKTGWTDLFDISAKK